MKKLFFLALAMGIGIALTILILTPQERSVTASSVLVAAPDSTFIAGSAKSLSPCNPNRDLPRELAVTCGR